MATPLQRRIAVVVFLLELFLVLLCNSFAAAVLMTISRRGWLMGAAGCATAIGTTTTCASAESSTYFSSPPPPTTISSSIEQQCRNGALAVEQAVPGAYQQACMALPSRRIPINRGRGDVVELDVLQQATGAGSTGTVVWNSSLLLTRLLERLASASATSGSNGSLLAGKTVLELGCGTGLVSLAAAALGAPRVIATDGNPNVVELAEQNIARNQHTLPPQQQQGGAASVVEAKRLQWGLLPAMDFADAADLVIGSDLTYFSGNWLALAETMATVTARNNGVILYLSLGHSGFSSFAETEGFLSVAAGYGLVPLVSQEALSERYLTNLLWSECMTPHERDMVSSSGGVRVVSLVRKY